MIKRLSWLLVLLLIGGILLSGCGGATEPPPTNTPVPEKKADTPTPVVEAPKAEPVVVSIWHGYTETEEETFSQVVADFEAANSDVKLEILAVPFDELQNKFQTEVASGGGPTLVTGPQDRMAGYAEAGLLAVFDGSAGFLSDLVAAAVDGGRVNGELVGIPINNKVVAMFYNKSMVDTTPADFDQLLALAAEHGMAITSDWFHNYMWGPAFGASFFDKDYKVVIDSPEGAQAYGYLKQVCESEGVTCDGNDGDMDTLFRQGQVAFRIQGPWASGDAIADLGAENVGVMAIPTIPGAGAPRPWNQSEMISMNVGVSAEEEAAAMRFIEYLTSADVQKLYLDKANWIPANSSVDTSSNPVVGGFLLQVPNSDPFPVAPELGATWGPMGDAVTKILEGVSTPEETLIEAANLINTSNNK
ncbi:MAG: extracellular solute-binding protein [Anaerolineales bacterium]|nr:extracellular solute-binding protein [Anaerolineales bacterium]